MGRANDRNGIKSGQDYVIWLTEIYVQEIISLRQEGLTQEGLTQEGLTQEGLNNFSRSEVCPVFRNKSPSLIYLWLLLAMFTQ